MLNIETYPLGSYQTNCYIVYEDDSPDCIVIDPGYEPDTVLLAIKGIKKNLAAILLTHGHFDHVGAVKILAADTDCRVYIHENDLSLPATLTAGALYYTHTYGEGDTLKIAGLSIRVLHTPGHTPGCVCLMVEDNLFTGDTLFRESCGRTDLPGGNGAEIFKSLGRLAALEGDFRVLPGHGMESTLEEEREYNPYMQ
jgi:glyoxylase-like metal-dependent hydrolase (beta-lactamase superfamily II)